MSKAESLRGELSLQVENVGGISRTSVTLSEGVSVLEGRNATNRTSFLQALMAAMGSDQYTLKGDAAEGRVELSLGDTVVERRFERRNGTVTATGSGYLDDPETADLFAFLLEENEARRAVARGENLHELLTRPIDTAEIEAEIELRQAEKRDIDDRLSSIAEREPELVELERRKRELESAIGERRERLDELAAEIDRADGDLSAGRESTAAIEERLSELKEHRSQLEDIRFQLETLRETIASLESEREEKQDRRAVLADRPGTDLDALRSDLADLRERQRTVTAQMNELQSVVQFNEEMLTGTDNEIAAVLADDDHDERDGPVTDQLLEDESSVTCWTCGSRVAREDIEETLDRLRSFRQEKLAERESIRDRIDETTERIAEAEASEDERESLEDRLAEIDVQLDAKRARIEELEETRETLHEEIEALEAAVEEEQSSDYDEILALHREANRVELELDQKEDELATAESEIEELESLLDDRAELEARRDQLVEELDELRNRIDRLEENAVEEFNDHMAEILDILGYENIARIWIERKERETEQGRRKVEETVFELHIVRESESGGAYEGTVETLSESEREVVGLVVALAGYLVHELYESVPVMLLDSLEAIDSDRIAKLVAYFAEYPEFLVVALLPEDADAVDVDKRTITEI
ncbi:archaea-specific SMC-related protein [Haloarchaeobius salinus]|uniref:archaea-specific SMC-related protein n=1 Tax=Haloarchaeobius salinus TaxID=1198298 RepID=UPI00210B62C2|nr:archaea-specific SMC-related protein [Haloarchaeobius salinus]